MFEHAADVGHFVRGERGLTLAVCIAAGFEQAIALTQWDFQRLSQYEQGVAAGLSATGFDEAHMTGRESRMHREIELAHPACPPPLAQKVTDGRDGPPIGAPWLSAWVHSTTGPGVEPLPPR